MEYLGWCMIMGATWMLGESKIRQLLIPNSSALASLCFVMILLGPIPLLPVSYTHLDVYKRQRFNRLKQDDQILHGTVSGTDIHTPDGVLDSLFHMGKCLLNFFNMSGSVRSGFQCEHCLLYTSS